MNIDQFSKVLTIIATVVITIGLPVLTFFGVKKFFIDPRLEARVTRRKYATVLYIACKELARHLDYAREHLGSDTSHVGDAMKKIPNNDFHGNIAWFTKDGYYATITAYKIAAVSAWLRIYQRQLLFSCYSESQSFLNELYARAQNLNAAFSTGTCLWFYYLNAVGDKLIEERADFVSTLNFAQFCSHYANDKEFRLFFEQLHMYIWFLGNRDPKYVATLPVIQKSLQELIGLLEQKNFLPGFTVERPPAAINELEKAEGKGWSGTK